MPAADEQQLIRRAKDGSHEAFRQLVERYMKHAYNVAYSFVNHHDDADDVAQEAFVRVYRSLHSFRGEAEFSTWLYRIVMNVALNRLKKKKRTASIEVTTHNLTELLASHDSNITRNIDIKMNVERALHELPTLQRAVVILRHIDGLSTKQVSNILKCSEGTVKTHLHRGLKKMKTSLQFLQDESV